VEVRDRLPALRPVRLGDCPRVAAVTFEELRITYQCPEQMARDLFAQVALEQALRAKAENKLNPPAPRRANRDREED
jgi:hypothetical protein